MKQLLAFFFPWLLKVRPITVYRLELPAACRIFNLSEKDARLQWRELSRKGVDLGFRSFQQMEHLLQALNMDIETYMNAHYNYLDYHQGRKLLSALRWAQKIGHNKMTLQGIVQEYLDNAIAMQAHSQNLQLSTSIGGGHFLF